MTDAEETYIARARRPHVALDLDSRRLKAIKIERLLDLAARLQPMRMLEIGTGSGGIAHYFATHPELRIDVDAVDVVDNRLITDGYRFQLVSGTSLPFADQTFDVVLTNHVIEHVGDQTEQLQHLKEIRRVLGGDGVGYLAVPNRWMLIEPHYRLAFLSWWPHRWRTPYLRAMRKGQFYDCEPLQVRQLERLFAEASLRFRSLCVQSIRATFEIERSRSIVARLLRTIPDTSLALLQRVLPTLIYRFSR